MWSVLVNSGEHIGAKGAGDMIRRAAAVGLCIATGVVLSVGSGQAEDGRQWLRDPYLPTTTAAILNADRLHPRLKREIVHIAGLPGRNQVPGLEGRGNLSVAFYGQDRPAPL